MSYNKAIETGELRRINCSNDRRCSQSAEGVFYRDPGRNYEKTPENYAQEIAVQNSWLYVFFRNQGEEKAFCSMDCFVTYVIENLLTFSYNKESSSLEFIKGLCERLMENIHGEGE